MYNEPRDERLTPLWSSRLCVCQTYWTARMQIVNIISCDYCYWLWHCIMSAQQLNLLRVPSWLLPRATKIVASPLRGLHLWMAYYVRLNCPGFASQSEALQAFQARFFLSANSLCHSCMEMVVEKMLSVLMWKGLESRRILEHWTWVDGWWSGPNVSAELHFMWF